MADIEIVGIGSSVYDTLIRVPRYPEEDTKMESSETRIQAGGPCATALAAARKLGRSAAYVGTLGSDDYGRFMLRDLMDRGVDVSRVALVPGISFHSTVLLSDAGGSRTCVWNRGTVPEANPAELDAAFLSEARVLHLDGHMMEMALSAAAICRKAGVTVSYDAGGVYPRVRELLPLVDWLVPSEEFALRVSGCSSAEDAACYLMNAYHPEFVAVTQGVRGGILLDERGFWRWPAYPVDAVDTNGSGDTFHGALIAGRLYGLSVREACRYASAAAAIKCTRLGARDAMADDTEVRKFLLQRGEPLAESVI